MADDNVDKWGEQSPVSLLFALIEEVGELTEEVLDTSADGTPEVTDFLEEQQALGEAVQSYLEATCETDDGEALPEAGRPAHRGEVALTDSLMDEVNDVGPLTLQLHDALSDDATADND